MTSTAASVALVATALLWLVCAVLVRRSSPGPVLYRQLRIGTGGFPFQIFKFRTMYVNSDDSAFYLSQAYIQYLMPVADNSI